MSDDQRKYPRRHLFYYLEVLDLPSNQVIGRLVDITPIGMMLISTKEFPEHKSVRLRLCLPQEFTAADHIDLQGESVWCHKDVNPDYYAIGFCFDAITLEQGNLINLVVKELGFRD
ncbi:MAG TPA: PilZ domain-containing protein [Bellilinea sp.]|jgi:hypothetical protein|nr:PilZ domain-containing protein [Bellilinea sp.]